MIIPFKISVVYNLGYFPILLFTLKYCLLFKVMSNGLNLIIKIFFFLYLYYNYNRSYITL